jgi:hypothetical protein
MTFPVQIEAYNGQFAASLVGAPNVRVVGSTRFQAIEALKAEIEHRIELGELTALEIDAVGVSGLAGRYSTDPTLHQICEDAYQKRNAKES